jgi:hypothetical protein
MGFFAVHPFQPSCTCVLNIKAVLINGQNYRPEGKKNKVYFQEKAKVKCPPTFSGVGIKIQAPQV